MLCKASAVRSTTKPIVQLKLASKTAIYTSPVTWLTQRIYNTAHTYYFPAKSTACRHTLSWCAQNLLFKIRKSHVDHCPDCSGSAVTADESKPKCNEVRFWLVILKLLSVNFVHVHILDFVFVHQSHKSRWVSVRYVINGAYITLAVFLLTYSTRWWRQSVWGNVEQAECCSLAVYKEDWQLVSIVAQPRVACTICCRLLCGQYEVNIYFSDVLWLSVFTVSPLKSLWSFFDRLLNQ